SMDHDQDSATPSDAKPFVTPQEARVLASLMEKQLATPKYYPLTPNALTQACNQKSSREPVMNLSEGEVRHILNLLEHRGLVKVDSGDRTYRISHRIKQHFDLERSELAVLTVLMLRYPQTLNDILRRTARMAEFSDADEVQLVVESLMDRDEPLVVLIPRGPGRREDRYWHTLCGPCKEEFLGPEKPESAKDAADDRLARLEDRIEQLEYKMDEVLRELAALQRE
ncbi:MAG: YceH family protein, partial [Gammaproteobacteria bacterium]